MSQDQDSQLNLPETEATPGEKPEQEPEEEATEGENRFEPAADGQAEVEEEAPARPPYTGKTPGEMLREAREARQLTIEDVVTQTRMSPETIRALEEDRDPPQNAWVYVRGYYRKYSRALKLPEEDVLDAHERYVGGAPEPEPVSAEWAPQDVSPSGPVPRFILVLIVGVILGGLLWWALPQILSDEDIAGPVEVLGGESGEQDAADDGLPDIDITATVRGDKAERAEADAARQPALGADQPESPAGNTDSGTSDGLDRTEAPEEEPAPGTVVTAPEDGLGSGPLHLSFTDRSWVNVVDAENKKLLDGIMQAGKEYSLDGVPPFRIFLGYAPGVEVSYKGREVDTEPHTTGNNTARFTVGDQQSGETTAAP